jgi:hypothetical protein
MDERALAGLITTALLASRAFAPVAQQPAQVRQHP